MANKKCPGGHFLFDDDLGAGSGFACEFAFFNLCKFDDTIDGRVNREIAADIGTRASNFGAASLADKNFASADFLATKTFDAKALTGIIMDVFT
jgi:hypothetical protein